MKKNTLEYFRLLVSPVEDFGKEYEYFRKRIRAVRIKF